MLHHPAGYQATCPAQTSLAMHSYTPLSRLCYRKKLPESVKRIYVNVKEGRRTVRRGQHKTFYYLLKDKLFTNSTQNERTITLAACSNGGNDTGGGATVGGGCGKLTLI